MGEGGPAFWSQWLRGLFAFDGRAPIVTSSGLSRHGAPDDGISPWGFWATLAWTLVIVVGCTFVTIFAFLKLSPGLFRLGSGLLPIVRLHVVTAIAVVPQVVAFYFIARLASESGLRYLGLQWPPLRYMVFGIGVAVAALVVKEAAILVFGGTFVNTSFVQAYRSAQSSHVAALYWICVGLVIPIGEEVTYRGFLFRGWSASGLGTTGTIVLTAFAWTVIHVPYTFLYLFSIFVLGLVLGWLRWRSGSIWPTIAAHMLVNLVPLTAAATAGAPKM